MHHLTAEAQALGARTLTTYLRPYLATYDLGGWVGIILAPHLAGRYSGPAVAAEHSAETRGPIFWPTREAAAGHRGSLLNANSVRAEGRVCVCVWKAARHSTVGAAVRRHGGNSRRGGGLKRQGRRGTDRGGTVRNGGTTADHGSERRGIGRRVKRQSGGRQQEGASTWSIWSAVINLTSRAGELRSAPSGPDDRYRVTG